MKKYFVLMEGGKDTTHIFKGHQPRQAALKAATRGFTEIKLRERGRKNKDKTTTIHVFKGGVKTIDKKANAPKWMADRVKKSNCKKLRVEHIKL